MYSAHFGMRTNPFLPLSDPDTIFRSSKVTETLQYFLHGRRNHHGIFLLTGEVGTGKTTAIRSAVAELPSTTPVAFLPPTLSTASELLDEICHAVGLSRRALESKADHRRRLEASLARLADEGRKTVLVADEAHLLSDTILEHLRLLTNVHSGRHPVLQMCLVAQPELVVRLRSDHLRPLRQRVTLRYTLMPLTQQEVRLYLIERVRAAGATQPDRLFDAEAVRAVYRLTAGIPREINVVADQAMTNAFVSNASVVRAEHVLSVPSDFGFEGLFVDRDQSPTPTVRRAAILAEAPGTSPEETRLEGMSFSPAAPAAHEQQSSDTLPDHQANPPSKPVSPQDEAPGLLDGLTAHAPWITRARARDLVRTAIGVPWAALIVILAGIALVWPVIRLQGDDPARSPAAEKTLEPPSSISTIQTSATSPPPVETSGTTDGAAAPPRTEEVKSPIDTVATTATVEAVRNVEAPIPPVPEPTRSSPSELERRYPSTLEVESDFPAVVWLGDERLGMAPGRFSPVSPGRYELKLELADARIISKDVIVSPGSTTYVRAPTSVP